MKRIVSFLFLIFILSNCSFDNKSGIWKEESKIKKKAEKQDKKKNLKSVFEVNKIFNEEVNLIPGKKIKIDNILKNVAWSDRFFDSTNNISNVHFSNENM